MTFIHTGVSETGISAPGLASCMTEPPAMTRVDCCGGLVNRGLPAASAVHKVRTAEFVVASDWVRAKADWLDSIKAIPATTLKQLIRHRKRSKREEFAKVVAVMRKQLSEYKFAIK